MKITTSFLLRFTVHILGIATSTLSTKDKSPKTYPNDTLTPILSKVGRTEFQLPNCEVKDECVVSGCKRVVYDGFVTDAEVEELLEIASIGMKDSFDLGGPTILDINTGYVRDPSGKLRTLYNNNNNKDGQQQQEQSPYSKHHYDLYRDVIERIRLEVQKTFSISNLHFTAPTFITREIGSLENNWIPEHIHDEYWHAHIDKNNTQHYDYSGLLYLSDYDKDFTGGMFAFLDHQNGRYTQERPCYDDDVEQMGAPHSCKEYASAGYCKSDMIADSCPRSCGACSAPSSFTIERDDRDWKKLIGTSRDRRTAHEVAPARGRLVIFSSGQENLHLVRQVRTGTRHVMSMWFTCDESRRFKNFLDGQVHQTYGGDDEEL